MKVEIDEKYANQVEAIFDYLKKELNRREKHFKSLRREIHKIAADLNIRNKVDKIIVEDIEETSFPHSTYPYQEENVVLLNLNPEDYHVGYWFKLVPQWIYHELGHVAEKLNPDFEYEYLEFESERLAEREECI